MNRRFTQRGLADHFEKLAALATGKEEIVLGAMAETTVKHQRAIMGDVTRLETLKPATQAERIRLNYTPNDPLVRSGKLRASISAAVMPGMSIAGSTSDLMPFHEFGEGHNPPRPDISMGTVDAEAENLIIAGEGAIAIASGDDRGLVALAAKAHAEAGEGAAV